MNEFSPPETYIEKYIDSTGLTKLFYKFLVWLCYGGDVDYVVNLMMLLRSVQEDMKQRLQREEGMNLNSNPGHCVPPILDIEVTKLKTPIAPPIDK